MTFERVGKKAGDHILQQMTVTDEIDSPIGMAFRGTHDDKGEVILIPDGVGYFLICGQMELL